MRQEAEPHVHRLLILCLGIGDSRALPRFPSAPKVSRLSWILRIARMTRLDDALARFSAALDQLEGRVEEANARAREAADSPAEISILKAERERMCARIGELEEESRALAGLTGEVEERLDGAIAEIREVLSRN